MKRFASAWALILFGGLMGCATPVEVRDARAMWSEGRAEEAVSRLQQGMQRLPDDALIRTEYFRRRDIAATQAWVAAEEARTARRPADARAAYERVLRLDPGHARAREGLAAIDADARHERWLDEAETRLSQGDTAAAEERVRAILSEQRGHARARKLLAQLRERQWLNESHEPVLKTALAKPLTLEFRDAPLRAVFDVIARTAGVNFAFDREVRTDTRVTLVIRDSPLDDVIRLILATHQLERKVLNDNSLLIYPNTQSKAREYQELVVRTFFLGDTDVKQALSLVRTVVKSRDVVVDEKLNALTVRDTPAAIRLVERLIDTIDRAESEVMLEVEVLEVSESRLRDIGLQFPTEVQGEQQLPAPSSVPTGRVPLWRPELVATVANPALRLKLLATQTDVNLLASPRIRAKNKEKARILIGEKLPVFTTTAVQNAGVSSSVSYIDVGLKLEVEPTVHLDDDVGIKVSLEVNTNLGEVRGPDGAVAFRLGTRSAQTHLRLRDGETQVLAGLINRNERDTLSRLPGLGDVPGVGRLFSANRSERDKSEIVLLITPRIVRSLAAHDIDTRAIAGGTELQAGARPLSIRSTAPRSWSLAPQGLGARAVGTPDPASPATPPAAASSAAASPAPAGAASAPAVRLRVPEQAALGREVTLAVEIENPGGAIDGDVVLVVEPPLLGDGRLPVRLSPSGGALAGAVTVRAQGAGAGSVSIEVIEARVRLGDGKVVTVEPGARAVLRIGL